MNTEDIIECIKAKDKEIDELRTDLQLLIFRSQRIGNMLKNVEQAEKPGMANGHVASMETEIDKLCSRYQLESKSSF